VRHPRILRQAATGPERQLEGGLQGKEGDRDMRERCPNDTVGLEAKPVSILGDGSLHSIDAEHHRCNT